MRYIASPGGGCRPGTRMCSSHHHGNTNCGGWGCGENSRQWRGEMSITTSHHYIITTEREAWGMSVDQIQDTSFWDFHQRALAFGLYRTIEPTSTCTVNNERYTLNTGRYRHCTLSCPQSCHVTSRQSLNLYTRYWTLTALPVLVVGLADIKSAPSLIQSWFRLPQDVLKSWKKISWRHRKTSAFGEGSGASR